MAGKKEDPVKQVKVAVGLEKKDPAIAALIALVCGLLLGAAGAGYIYLGKVKKGIVYIVASWVLAGVVTAIYAVITAITLGIGGLCFPIFLLIPAFNLLITWDVYLQAQGKKTILPEIKE